jgi:hypothetical protein
VNSVERPRIREKNAPVQLISLMVSVAPFKWCARSIRHVVLIFIIDVRTAFGRRPIRACASRLSECTGRFVSAGANSRFVSRVFTSINVIEDVFAIARQRLTVRIGDVLWSRSHIEMLMITADRFRFYVN